MTNLDLPNCFRTNFSRLYSYFILTFENGKPETSINTIRIYWIMILFVQLLKLLTLYINTIWANNYGAYTNLISNNKIGVTFLKLYLITLSDD